MSYQDVGVAVSRYDRANVHDGWHPSLRLDGLQLHVVRHHHMCQDDLEQHCGKVASRATVTQTDSVSGGRKKGRRKDEVVPCMSAEPKGQKLGRQRGNRACRTFAVVVRRVCKSERRECLGVGVVSVIVVQTLRGRHDQCPLWYTRAVRECKVF